MFVQAGQFHRVKLVVEDRAFAADEVRVEIVRLKAIDHRRALPHGAALEAQDRGGAGGIFVGGENWMLALRRIARDFLHVAAQAEEQGVEGVATGGEQGAAAEFFLCSAILSYLTDPVIVIDLAIVQRADESWSMTAFWPGITTISARSDLQAFTPLVFCAFHLQNLLRSMARGFSTMMLPVSRAMKCGVLVRVAGDRHGSPATRASQRGRLV